MTRRIMLRCYLYICVAGTLALFGQTSGHEPVIGANPAAQSQPEKPTVQAPADRQAHSAGNQSGTAPQITTRPESSPRKIPSAQYSPLAAAGGYAHPGVSPWEAIVNYLNPRRVNMGQVFDERKQAWLDNAAANQYFWYSFCVTALLVLSWFALAWIHNDRLRETWELAECAADALRYSEYCKRKADHAIARYNEHVEKCNRVVESAESGMVTPETATLNTFKEELRKVRADNESLTMKNAHLEDQLTKKDTSLKALSDRVTQAEQKIQASKSAANPPNPELVERIRRLEQQNRNLRQQIERGGNGKGAANAAKPTDTESERC
ncbi:MAG: hypothetical protein JOZ62_10025 [Acidobacteriaceae bacterium]|nr:hypothetical protein [Acidobacteriaceae bacterium]